MLNSFTLDEISSENVFISGGQSLAYELIFIGWVRSNIKTKMILEPI